MSWHVLKQRNKFNNQLETVYLESKYPTKIPVMFDDRDLPLGVGTLDWAKEFAVKNNGFSYEDLGVQSVSSYPSDFLFHVLRKNMDDEKLLMVYSSFFLPTIIVVSIDESLGMTVQDWLESYSKSSFALKDVYVESLSPAQMSVL